MASNGRSRADENKSIRQEALREQLASKGLMQQAIEIANKLEDLNIDLEPADAHRLKASADIKMKLVAKYMPDMKSVEHSGEIATNDATELSDSQLLNIATSGSTGTTKQANSKKVTH